MHEHIINTPIKDLPPLVEVIFLESMYFHSLSFRKINKGLFFHVQWTASLCLSF